MDSVRCAETNGWEIDGISDIVAREMVHILSFILFVGEGGDDDILRRVSVWYELC